MATVQGIIFSDIFITNKKQFIKFFTQYYQQNQAQIDQVVKNLYDVLDQYKTNAVTESMAGKFEPAWKDFENYVLLNQNDLELLVVYRGTGGRDGQFTEIVPQREVMGSRVMDDNEVKYGIDTGHQLLEQHRLAKKSQDVEKFLQFHVNNFLNQLASPIDRKTAELLHHYHSNELYEYYATSIPHLTGVRWSQAFYNRLGMGGGYYGGRGLGMAYDAFMNHMANHETNIFNFLRSSGKNNSELTIDSLKGKNSVYIEEKGVIGDEIGGKREGNFPRLLRESRNHIGWYTGGDIVIVDPKTMSVVYNIQLKTTTEKSKSVFGEKVAAIRKFITNFMNLSSKEKAEALFDFALTSISNHDDFNKMPQKDVDEMVKQHLETLTKDISVKKTI